MKMKRTPVFIAQFLLVLVLFSCTDKRLKVTSEQQVELKFSRFDRTLFEKNSEGLRSLSEWYFEGKKNNDMMMRRYVEDIMRVSAFGNPMGVNMINRFASDTSWIQLQDDVESTFGDLETEKKELNTSFTKYRALFPKDELPEIFFYNSGFGTAIFPDTNLLGIGLEWFLGKENAIIKRLPPENFPKYKREKMEKNLLVISALRGHLLVHKYYSKAEGSLLALMVYYGKVQLAMEALFPNEDLHKLFLFKEEDLAWAKSKEAKIWKVLIKDNLLFDNAEREKIRWTSDGPFTSGLPEGAPSRLGIFMGYKIVKAYFEKNKDLTFEQLFAEESEKKILQAYKPF
jgi:hypothetical protein